ncbi:ATP synthase subunit G atp20 [Pleosporales sp. CAS-2024a]
MSLAASRALLRQSTFAVRRAGLRNASTTSEAAGAVKDQAAQTASKASEGLRTAQSSAGAAASKASEAASATAQKASGLAGTVQGLVPTLTYYSKVGLELGKLIVHQRGMTPPSVQQMQAYVQPALNALRQPASLFNRVASEASSTSPQQLLNQVRGMSSAQWASIGVVAAEVIGFFSVGEMIGRFKLVGYRAKQHSGEH